MLSSSIWTIDCIDCVLLFTPVHISMLFWSRPFPLHHKRFHCCVSTTVRSVPFILGLVCIMTFLLHFHPSLPCKPPCTRCCCLVAKLCLWLFSTPWTVAPQTPLYMRFPRQEYWSGLSFPSTGDFPNPGIEPRSPAFQVDSLPAEPQGKLYLTQRK